MNGPGHIVNLAWDLRKDSPKPHNYLITWGGHFRLWHNRDTVDAVELSIHNAAFDYNQALSSHVSDLRTLQSRLEAEAERLETGFGPFGVDTSAIDRSATRLAVATAKMSTLVEIYKYNNDPDSPVNVDANA